MLRFSTARNRVFLLAAASLILGYGSSATGRSAQSQPNPHAAAVAPAAGEPIAPYHARFGRQHPILAIVGVNSGTELTDYVIPYGILHQADLGEVIAVATRPGVMTMRPALHIQPQATIAAFDARFPDGADYVVVPAVAERNDPALLAWIKQKAEKGGTLVSICDGALVLANSGVLDGHRATAHWATTGYRRKHYPQVNWIDDRRYVADGHIVSKAGVSAAIPTSLALVEAIAGHERAAMVAAQFSVPLAAQTRDQAFVELHGWMAANLAADLSVGQLAVRAGMAPRTFARAYAAKVGRTPAKTVELMRIEAACRALEETNLPLKSIAQITGHGDEQNLRRAFQRQLVTNPATHRLRFSSLLP